MLVYKGGSFTHTDVYNMPTYLRKAYLQMLQETLEAESKSAEDATKNASRSK